jgi:hypothetical protein
MKRVIATTAAAAPPADGGAPSPPQRKRPQQLAAALQGVTAHHGTFARCTDGAAKEFVLRVTGPAMSSSTGLAPGGDLSARCAFIAAEHGRRCQDKVTQLLDPAQRKRIRARSPSTASDDGDDDDE